MKRKKKETDGLPRHTYHSHETSKRAQTEHTFNRTCTNRKADSCTTEQAYYVLWHSWKHQATAKVNHARFQLTEQTLDAHSKNRDAAELRIRVSDSTARVSCSGTLNGSCQRVCARVFVCRVAQSLGTLQQQARGLGQECVTREQEQTVLAVQSRNEIRIWKYSASPPITRQQGN